MEFRAFATAIRKGRSAAPILLTFLVAPTFALLAGYLIGEARAGEPAHVTKEVGPQVTKLPLDVVEPPRNVAAAEWKSPYCGRWFDGCTQCSRESVNSEPRCVPRQGLSAGDCVRHAVLCLAPMSIASLTNICAAYDIEDYFYDSRGNIIERSVTENTDDCERALVNKRLQCKLGEYDFPPMIMDWGYKYWQLADLRRLLIYPLLPPGLPVVYKRILPSGVIEIRLNSISRLPSLTTRYLPNDYGYTCTRSKSGFR
jgi:hypothetical protein